METANTRLIGPTRKLIWINIIFFAATALISLIGGPFYIAHFGLPPALVWYTVFYVFATSMSITVGYHRLFSHVTFKANPVIEFLFLFFGAAAFQQSALEWASQHRDHHLYVDTEQDAYSIKKGFFYAHIGWLMFWKHTVHYENVNDLKKRPMVMHQFKHYYLWAIGSGIVFPTLIGALAGGAAGALGSFIFVVAARIAFVHHSTWCINSVCHMFGRATYDIDATAKDHWFVAFLTNGEGYHNFHHRFPGDYRNGVRWYQWDPSKWLIALLSKARLTSDLKRVSKFKILEARLRADHTRVQKWILQTGEHPRWERLQADLEAGYKLLGQRLLAWERRSYDYRDLVCGRIRHQSRIIHYLAKRKMNLSRQRFQQGRREWEFLIKSNAPLASIF